MVKKENINVNYYKISTFVLLGFFVLFGIVYAMNYYCELQFESGAVYGQQATLEYTLNEVEKNGYIVITTPKYNLSLVPSQMIQMGQEEVVKQILDLVDEKGYVSLYDNDTEIILVPYTPPVVQDEISELGVMGEEMIDE